MTKLIGIDFYSFSMEEGFSKIRRDYVEDSHTEIKHFLYIFSGYININTIKLIYNTGKIYHKIENKTKTSHIELVKIVFCDGSNILTSTDDVEKIRSLGDGGTD